MHKEPKLELRPYQRHTVQANADAWTGQRRPTGTGPQNRTGNVLATGMGKTVIFAEMARAAHESGKRPLILVHREELATQARTKLHTANPKASIGLIKDKRDEWNSDIVIASVPTLARAARLGRIPSDHFGLGIADECHHAAADSWFRVMDHFGAYAPAGRAVPWAGFTATMTRGDAKVLGDVWPEIVANFGIDYGIKNGYLVPVRGKRVQIRDLMLERVKRSRGDLSDGDLGEALADADAGAYIVRAWEEHAAGRRTAMFSPTVATAERFAQDFIDAGVSAEVVTGDTPTEQRQAIYERFRLGETLVISSVMVLTEGWDAPWAEVCVMARPTQLPGLYAQCVGRVLRPFPAGGKTGALILDVVGVSDRVNLADLTDLVGKKSDPYGDEDARPTNAPDEDDEPSSGLDLLPSTELYDPNAELVYTDFDLFEKSTSAWLQTEWGIWFLPTKQSYFFLYPTGDGSFTLGSKAVNSAPRHKATAIERDLTLEGGMTWAEWHASRADDEFGAAISSRKAYWRNKPPSDKLLAFALRCGITPQPGERQGELSDRVTVARATRVLPRPRSIQPR